MGAAKQRGTREQRVAQAQERNRQQQQGMMLINNQIHMTPNQLNGVPIPASIKHATPNQRRRLGPRGLGLVAMMSAMNRAQPVIDTPPSIGEGEVSRSDGIPPHEAELNSSPVEAQIQAFENAAPVAQ